jgi:hypothetical protein
MENTPKKGMSLKHPLYGKGSIIDVNGTILNVHFPNRGNMDISLRAEGLEWFEDERTEEESGNTGMPQIEKTLRKILSEFADLQGTVDIGEKWKGGTLILQPEDKSLKPKEIPVETFFHKIVMIRDRVRVMEQQINAHSVLSDAEKVDLQQYITRIYGSLTTFNVLFKHQDDYFVGEKKS